MESNFLNPQDIIGQVSIEVGSKVADFGCGAGFFSLAFADAVGPEGTVYALDVLKSALESVQSRARIKGHTNLVAKRVNLEKVGGSGLEPDSLDWVVVKDMLFQNKGKDIILKEAHRVLKPGGRAMVIEWNEKAAGLGPEAALRVNEVDLEKTLAGAGFIIDKKINAGNFHYGFVVSK